MSNFILLMSVVKLMNGRGLIQNNVTVNLMTPLRLNGAEYSSL